MSKEHPIDQFMANYLTASEAICNTAKRVQVKVSRFTGKRSEVMVKYNALY